MKIPETEELRTKLTVAQLRKILASASISIAGLKKDLLSRLETYLITSASAKNDFLGVEEDNERKNEKKKKRARDDDDDDDEEGVTVNDDNDQKKNEGEKEEGDVRMKAKRAKAHAVVNKKDDEDGKKVEEKVKIVTIPTTTTTTTTTTQKILQQIGPYERLFARRSEISYENFPPGSNEDVVERVFETYGKIQEILNHDKVTGEGTLRFQSQEAAEGAIAALTDANYVMDGSEKAVEVRWATWEKDVKDYAHKIECDVKDYIYTSCNESARSSKQVWIGAASKLASDELVKAWLEKFGEVEHFKAFRKEKHFSFLATYVKEEDAKLCVRSLNEKPPPGALAYHAPLVVEFSIVDEKVRTNVEKLASKVLQHRSGGQPQQNTEQATMTAAAATAAPSTQAAKKDVQQNNRQQQQANNNDFKRSTSRDAIERPDSRNNNNADPSQPPIVVEQPSSSEAHKPEVIANYLKAMYPRNKLPRRGQFPAPNPMQHGTPSEKLYIASIPFCYDKNDMLPIFEALGVVTDVHIMYDHHTKKHKGSGFVTFRTFEEAERTIGLLDQKYILDNQDPSMTINKPMYFKFAKSRMDQQKPQMMMGGGAHHQQHQQNQFHHQQNQHRSMMSGGGAPAMASMASMASQNQFQNQQFLQMQMQMQQQQQYWMAMQQQQQQQQQQMPQQGQPYMPQQQPQQQQQLQQLLLLQQQQQGQPYNMQQYQYPPQQNYGLPPPK